MVTKSIKLLIIPFFVAILLSPNICSPCLAKEKYVSAINWDCLNLSVHQRAQIKILDLNWQKTRKNLSSQIIRDKETLKYLLTDPFVSDKAIRGIQSRILTNQKKLRYRAMENFLRKRSVLTILQRRKLHKMLAN